MSEFYEVALIEGDGIGPEICWATKEVIAAAGVAIEWIEIPIGIRAKEKYGEEMPSGCIDQLREIGVALKAPLITEKLSRGVVIQDADGERRYPSINNALRRELQTWANLRPIKGFQGVSGKYAEMDLVIVREVSEGIYSGLELDVSPNTGHSIKQTTRAGSERIIEYALDYAVVNGRHNVTAVHKANVLHKTDGLFLAAFHELAEEVEELHCDDLMIDAACYHLIKNPAMFDVVVTPNQYGDIFSDVAAALAGSMGLAPGANIGDDIAFFEASHGAAPDIAGKGIVNPVSLILSGSMMLNYIGEADAALAVWEATQKALEKPENHTPELGGSAGTKSLTEAIIGNL